MTDQNRAESSSSGESGAGGGAFGQGREKRYEGKKKRSKEKTKDLELRRDDVTLFGNNHKNAGATISGAAQKLGAAQKPNVNDETKKKNNNDFAAALAFRTIAAKN